MGSVPASIGEIAEGWRDDSDCRDTTGNECKIYEMPVTDERAFFEATAVGDTAAFERLNEKHIAWDCWQFGVASDRRDFAWRIRFACGETQRYRPKRRGSSRSSPTTTRPTPWRHLAGNPAVVAPSNPVSVALWRAANCLADRYRHKWPLTFGLVSESLKPVSLVDEDRIRSSVARKRNLQ